MKEISNSNISPYAKQSPFRGYLSVVAAILSSAVLLFGSAGTIDWLFAWMYLFIFLVILCIVTIKINPDLQEERRKKHDDAKRWDQVLVLILFLMGSVILIVAGLDRRFGWTTNIPVSLQIGGFCLVIIGYILSIWAVLCNDFFSTFVRIQNDRDHHPVSSGPYQFIRHPGYAGMMLYILGEPFMLGSFWAIIPALIMIMLLIIRTLLEDATLRYELTGYKQYAQHVRYQLVPYLW